MPELSYAYRISRYDPRDRDEHGHYTGTEPDESDHGPVEDAHVAAVALLHDASAVQLVDIWWPLVSGLLWAKVPPAELP